MTKKLSHVLSLCLLLAIGRTAQGMTITKGAWEITADRIIHQDQPAIVVAEGAVVLNEKDGGEGSLIIEADWLKYDMSLEKVEARGNIIINREGERLRASKVVFDLDRQRGSIHDGVLFLPRQNLHFYGNGIEKSGDTYYHLQDGVITSCPLEEGKAPAWSIAATEGDIVLDEDAVLRNAVLKVKDVPIFYTPYLYFPILPNRQSGLLFPELSHSERDGSGLIAPYFLDLSASSDLTIYPGYLANRGVVAGAEWRYALDDNSKGMVAVTHLDDDLEEATGNEYKSDGYVRHENRRYWIRAKADHEFPYQINTKLDFDLVSDRDYLQEYRQGITGFNKNNEVFTDLFGRGFQEESIPFRESRIQATRDWDSVFGGVELLAVRDVWDEPAVVTPLQAVPRLRFDGRTPAAYLGSQGIEIAWENEYVNYWRKRGIGEHRLDLHPRFSTAIPLDRRLETTVALGLRETMYEIEDYGQTAPWPYDDFQTRSFWDGSIDFALPLLQTFALPYENLTSVTHLLRPNVGYRFVPDHKQEEIPFLDEEDRLGSTNWLLYGIDNFFSFHGGETGTDHTLRRGYFKMSQAYDIHEQHRDETSGGKIHPFSDLLFEMKAVPIDSVILSYETAMSVYGRGVTHYDLESRYQGRRGEHAAIKYRYNRHPETRDPYFFVDNPEQSIHELNFSLGGPLTDTLSVRGNVSRSLGENHTVDTTVALLYAPQCWGVELLAAKSPDDTRLAVVFSLSGLGKMVDLGLSVF